VLDRNFTKFILLTPGTQQLQWQHAASENPQGSTQIQVNGQHFSGTGYQLDGTENRDPILGIIVVNPNLESIAETKITSQNYDAEFGQATAGVVSVQTKSGRNEIFGSLFEFYQDERFQARNPFTQPTKESLPDTTRHLFGGSVGGPIVQNRTFFFGDYQGTRATQGGSRLLTVPTAGRAHRRPERVRDQHLRPGEQRRSRCARTVRGKPDSGRAPVAAGPGAAAADSAAEPARCGRRHARQLPGVGRRDVRRQPVQRPHRPPGGRGRQRLRTLQPRRLLPRRADGLRHWRRTGTRRAGGVSDVRNQSLALGMDRALSSNLLVDVRFGWFRYNVNVLPFDYGTTPAADAGIPGLNLDTTFTSGLPALFVGGDRGFNAGSGLGVNRCNCPLDQDEQQWQIVGNVTRIIGDHSVKFGVDVRRAYNLRVPSDAHRSGELTFNADRTSLGGSGGLGLATFLLGDVTSFRRYVSPNTDARERQWRHFYYAQDTWRVNQRLTLNYGLRLDIINPQTVNEPGNAGFLDLSTGEIMVAGVGDINLAGNVENKLNWAPRLGVTYQLDERTVIRGGYGRTYDIGVFGSLFGHSVTQNLPVLAVQELNAPSNFDRVFTLNQGPVPPTFPDVPANGRFPLPNGVFARALPTQQRPPTVDAFNVTVQRQVTDVMSVEVGYVGNRGRDVFAGDGPAINVNDPTLDGFLQGVPRDDRRPFYSGRVRTVEGNYGGAFGWTQGIDFFCNCANNWYDSLQARVVRRFAGGYSWQANYTWQKAEQEGGSYFFFDRSVDRGVADWDRAHIFNLVLVYEVPFGSDKRWGTTGRARRTCCSAAGRSTSTRRSRAACPST
jgi:outer membrane receptor protein involved in Fe transport